ncbi:MAG TPA: LysR family transcriptional regulator [Caulobacteraceae bacterium]|jgi:DNA-binding transcriptional LysR family regulator
MTFDARLLSGIGVLAAVVDSGGFAKAGEAVGLTPSGVSRAISRLEERVGARLFDRHPRKVALTEAGQRLHAEASPLLAAILEAAEAAAGDSARVRGRLKLNVDPWFARVVLAPRLQELLTRHPELAVDLQITNHAEEMFAAGVDLAVRFGPPPDSALISRKLLDTRVITVASPAYLARRPPPLTPAEVAGHEAILFRDPQSGRPFAWEFHRAGEVVEVPVASRLVMDDPSVALAACEAGSGLFQSFELGLEPWIQAGRLVPVLTDWAEERFPLYAYYASRRQLPAKVRAFLDFIVPGG